MSQRRSIVSRLSIIDGRIPFINLHAVSVDQIGNTVDTGAGMPAHIVRFVVVHSGLSASSVLVVRVQ